MPHTYHWYVNKLDLLKSLVSPEFRAQDMNAKLTALCVYVQITGIQSTTRTDLTLCFI